MTMRLVDLEPGGKALVRQIEGGRAVIARLAALGFTPGAPVKVIRKNEHGPLLVTLRGTQIALGHEEADRILISPIHEDSLTKKTFQSDRRITIALSGQPNVGKSSVFNLLTGLNQHVGNWTGKTVEQKRGQFDYKGRTFSLVDLPGTYSLTANSEEERIARDFILKEKPDVVVAVVDAATLERNLYLVAELLLLPAPVVLALNMMDVAAQEGIQVEPKVLETALGIPVIPMTATRRQGMDELEESILRMVSHELPYSPKRPSILAAHQAVLDELQNLIELYVPSIYPRDWVALKLLEGDEELTGLMQAAMPPEKWEPVRSLLYQHEDAILDIAGARYEWIARMVRAAVVEPKVSRVGLTARLDRTLTHPVLGSLVLISILGAVFWLTYALGSPLQSWLSNLVHFGATLIRSEYSSRPGWLVELIAGGLLGGVGMVITFLPIIAIFYAILGFMEDTGYLARAAYLTDRLMHLIGLHGKSFMPILLGFGCNVPAVLGTRIIESRRARLLTILLIPFIPCTARMTVVTILAPMFFGKAAALVAWGLVMGNMLFLGGLGFVLHHFFFEDEHVPFIMELPLYHLPNIKTIGLYVWHNLVSFLQKAGTTILVASLIIWAVSYFPGGGVMNSYLAGFGKALEPIGHLMGLPWPMLVALITSLVAKENTIATLGVLYGNLNTALPALIPAAAALGMLVFQMLFIPCIATVAAIRQETHSLRWTAVSLTIMLLLSFGMGVLVFQIGRLV